LSVDLLHGGSVPSTIRMMKHGQPFVFPFYFIKGTAIFEENSFHIASINFFSIVSEIV
jgi:hypothetical protein